MCSKSNSRTGGHERDMVVPSQMADQLDAGEFNNILKSSAFDVLFNLPRDLQEL